MNSDTPQSNHRIQDQIEQIFLEKEIKFRFGDYKHKGFTHEFVFTTKALFEFLEKNIEQTRFISLLKEALEDPYEIWQAFEKNNASGRVRLQYKLIKAFALKNEGVGMVAIFEAIEGAIQFKEFFTIRGLDMLDQMNRFRAGQPVYVRTNLQPDD